VRSIQSHEQSLPHTQRFVEGQSVSRLTINNHSTASQIMDGSKPDLCGGSANAVVDMDMA